DEHGTGGELGGTAIVARVQLLDVAGEEAPRGRNARPLVGTGPQDDIPGLEGRLPTPCLEPVAGPGQSIDARTESQRRADERGVLAHVADHLVARHEPPGIRPRIEHPGKTERVVGCDQREAVPAVRPRAAQRLPPIDQQVLDPGALQPVAGGEPRLTCSDDQRVHLLAPGRHGPPPCVGGDLPLRGEYRVRGTTQFHRARRGCFPSLPCRASGAGSTSAHTSACRKAWAVAAERDRTSSLWRMLLTCRSTVRSLRKSVVAISPLLLPAATRRSTSSSREVSPGARDERPSA